MSQPSFERHGFRVLVVDDDLDEHFFAQLALEKVLPVGSVVQMGHSGNEAMAYMIGEGKFADRATYPFPSLIITDLKMADGDGFHVLESLKNPCLEYRSKVDVLQLRVRGRCADRLHVGSECRMDSVPRRTR